jgi:orotidine-5'-phosphate decarboxylase
MINPLYCALDTSSLAQALEIAQALTGYVGGFKIGMEFFYAHGFAGAERIASIGAPLFLDLKLHDIANTVAGGIKNLLRLKPHLINVHCLGGSAMLQAAHAAVMQTSPQSKLLGVTILTSLDTHDLVDLGFQESPMQLVNRLARLAQSAHLAGVVCSAHDVASLKAFWPDGVFVVPGLRLEDSPSHEQKRVMTPRAALGAGATYLVIGRPITQATDPVAAAQKILHSLSQEAL